MKLVLSSVLASFIGVAVFAALLAHRNKNVVRAVCLPNGPVVSVSLDDVKEVPENAIPPVIKFPITAIPEAKALSLKGEVVFSLVELNNLVATCKAYEASKWSF